MEKEVSRNNEAVGVPAPIAQGELTSKAYLDEVMDYMIRNQAEMQTLFAKKVPEAVTRATIETDKPIVLLLASDIHFGSVYTSYKKLKEIWDWIIETDRVHLVVVGDWIDNFDAPVPKLLSVGINSQMVSPDIQRQVYKTYLKVLQEKKKITAMVLGNHENFSNLDLWFEGDLKFPIAPNRMYLYLTVGTQEYKIALVHKSRFNSILNPNHSNIREMHFNYPDADIIVTSHTHMPATQYCLYPKDGQQVERLLIKTGSLKHDPYSYQFFNPHGIDEEMAVSTVVLSPHKRKMGHMPFYDALESIL